MDRAVVLVVWMLFAIQLKHFLCDFALQTQRQVATKGIYGHPAGFSHAMLHGLASIPALLILTGRAGVVVAIVAAEVVIHYHTDWLKAQADRRFHLTVQQHAYWVIFGADQLIHQLTYAAMILAVFGGGWARA